VGGSDVARQEGKIPYSQQKKGKENGGANVLRMEAEDQGSSRKPKGEVSFSKEKIS